MEVGHLLLRRKSKRFLLQYQDVQSIQDTKAEIMASVEKQQDELNHFSQLLDQLVNQTKRIHKMNPLLPFELSLSEKAMHLDRSISELNIWQATGASYRNFS